jgi:hypothetical protein
MIALILRLLGPVVEMLGQAVGGATYGKSLALPNASMSPLYTRAAGLLSRLRVLRVHRVAVERGFERLVVLGERAFGHQLAAEQAADAFRVHDEGHDVLVGRGIRTHVGHVVAAPLVAQPT